eukprot:TRINITY_DN570_c0_g4_i2.p1 TRINITY_DN570_c0_g4~~TRINITY_DN570_c0_g4_i2.p1  ORF type:complete len:194 (+),score=24.85 TRINITY_DN570_c0_g4_i2:614-1195(+)
MCTRSNTNTRSLSLSPSLPLSLRQMHVAFGRASTALSGKEKLGGPKEDTLLWKARDSLAQKKGSRHTVYATNGEEYTGEWLNNCKHGKGVMIYKNGDKYDGFWEQDRRHGQGSFFVKRGARLRLQYTGEWQDDKRWVSRASILPLLATVTYDIYTDISSLSLSLSLSLLLCRHGEITASIMCSGIGTSHRTGS